MRPAHEAPSLTALRAFDATARLGSMTRAADTLNVTHGAISRQIRQLEKQLGTALFSRAHGKLTLTKTGQTLAHQAHESFARLYACWESLLSAQQAQPLTLGCTGSLLSRWLIPRMASLPILLQDMRLHVVSTDNAMAFAGTGVDAAVVYLKKPQLQGHEVIPLYPERFGPVFSPSLWAQHRECKQPTLDDMMSLPLLSTQSRAEAWPLWLNAQAPMQWPIRFQQSFQHALYLLEAAEAGLGVAMVPDVLAADALAQHRLMAPFPFLETDEWLCLVLDPLLSKHSPKQVEALKAWAANALAKLPDLTEASHN